jgi:hypothetical protein
VIEVMFVGFAFPLFLGEPIWTTRRFICCCHLRSCVLSLWTAVTCFLFSLASSCHANTTNRFHIKFFPHCIPPRLVSSVVSSRSSFRCKAYWENAISSLVLHGTCGWRLSLLLFCPVFSAVILFHFPFHYCQKAVFVRTFFLFICRRSNSLTFRLHACFLMDRFSLFLMSVVMHCRYVICFRILKRSSLAIHWFR